MASARGHNTNTKKKICAPVVYVVLNQYGWISNIRHKEQVEQRNNGRASSSRTSRGTLAWNKCFWYIYLEICALCGVIGIDRVKEKTLHLYRVTNLKNVNWFGIPPVRLARIIYHCSRHLRTNIYGLVTINSYTYFPNLRACKRITAHNKLNFHISNWVIIIKECFHKKNLSSVCIITLH